MAADRGDIVGEHVFRACKVLYLSFEDGEEEILRRFQAAMKYHNVSVEDIAGSLFVQAITQHDMKLAMQKRGGEVVIGPLVAKLKAMIERHHFEVIIFDPLIKTHAVQENDNAAMDAVADIMAGLAAKYKLSIDAPHHTRKGAGEPGNADVGRGSSATKDAGRLVYTLSKMTEKECATYKGVSETERKYLIRHDPAKVNIAPPSADTKWLRLVSVALGNGTIEYPRGDHVQTVEVWHPTDWLEGVSNERLGELATIIDEGFLHSTGERRYYGDHIQCKDTPRDVFALVAKHLPELNGLQARSLIRTWKKNDTLREEKYLDPEFRRERGCLRLNYHNKPGAIHATET
jgi:hypothetical protein